MSRKDYIEINKLFDDFVTWLKTPNPDTILLKIWKRKRARAKVIQRIEANKQAEEDRQSIEKEAYLLWEADGGCVANNKQDKNISEKIN